MTNYMKRLMVAMNEYATEYGLEALLEEFFPEMTPGELLVEMYEAGMIPDDQIEKFLD